MVLILLSLCGKKKLGFILETAVNCFHTCFPYDIGSSISAMFQILLFSR